MKPFHTQYTHYSIPRTSLCFSKYPPKWAAQPGLELLCFTPKPRSRHDQLPRDHKLEASRFCGLVLNDFLNNFFLLVANLFSSVLFSRPVMSNSETPWTAAHQASLSITNSQSLLKLMSTESVMPSNHLILCHPLLLLPSIFTSIWVFTNKSVLRIRWPKYWSFSFNTSPASEYSGLISFKMDWLDLLLFLTLSKSIISICLCRACLFPKKANSAPKEESRFQPLSWLHPHASPSSDAQKVHILIYWMKEWIFQSILLGFLP